MILAEKGKIHTVLSQRQNVLQKSLQDQTLACPTSATFAVQASCSATEQTDSEQISSAGKHTPFVYSWNDPYVVVVVVDLVNTVIVVCAGNRHICICNQSLE